MKEKWIKKLIKYLNEYDDWMVSWFEKYVEEFGVFILNTEQMMEEEIIISKSFGFIKWLVDNDKIDTLLFADELNKVVYLSDFVFRNDEWFFKTIYKQLLMLLSIQDNPIEFLISILK